MCTGETLPQWRLLKNTTVPKAVLFFIETESDRQEWSLQLLCLAVGVCPPDTTPIRPPGGWAGMLWGGALEEPAGCAAHQFIVYLSVHAAFTLLGKTAEAGLLLEGAVARC